MDDRSSEEKNLGLSASEVARTASDDEVPPHLAPAAKSGALGRLRALEESLDRKLGVESHSISRKRPEDKDPSYATWSNQAVMFLLWMSGTMNLSCFATGFLGWEFGLDLRRSLLIVAFGTLLGSAVTGWCATMGAPTGLRQVSISRYSLGWWPSKIIAALNVVEQVGWSSVGSITGGLALSAASGGRIGTAPGVVICAVLGFLLSFVGLKAVFQYEKFAGIVFFVIFLVMYGETAGSGDLSTPTELQGATLSGTALTLFAIVYGSSASWCSIAADYYVEYPPNISKVKVFILTTLGICIPTCLGMFLGCIVSSSLSGNQDWADAYDLGLGFLINKMLYPAGFAKFILVLLVLSGVGMNCIALYSAGLSVQQFARPLGLVPRFFWTLLSFVAIILLSLVGRDQLLVYLENFLSLLGYWNTSFFVMVASEHYLFRRAATRGYDMYDLDGWNDPKRMPVGFGGIVGFAAGIAGAVVGMAVSWYVGPLAAKIGDFGGDIGNQLSFVFTLLAYIPARWAEYKYVGR